MDLVTVEVVLDTMEGILNSLVSVVEVDFLSNLEAWVALEVEVDFLSNLEVWVALEEEVESLNSLEVWAALEEEVAIMVEDSLEVVVENLKCLEAACVWEEAAVAVTDVTETRL